MEIVSIEFCLITSLILIIFVINVSQILYLIICKNNKENKFFRSILLNYSFSSLIIAVWLIPFFYFRTIWLSDSISWRLWSFIFHIVDAVQLYSLLLLITNTNTINLSLQRLFLSLIWLAPVLTYSPLLWLSFPNDKIDYLPYRRLSMNVPWWILPILYSTMYLIPILISFVLLGITIFWPWISKQCKNKSGRQVNEHRENMAELTSLIETVLNFELDQSTINTLNTWVPSISSLTNRSTNTDHTSLSYISNKFNHSLSYKVSQDLSSSLQFNNNNIQKLNYRLLFIITCLLLLVHLPYVLFSLMDISLSQLPIFIYIHWFGTMFIPIIHLQKNN